MSISVNVRNNAYSLSIAIAAALAAVLLAPISAAAQQVQVERPITIVGAINDPAAVENVSDAEDATIPELPVVEDETPAAAAAENASAADARANLSQIVEAQ